VGCDRQAAVPGAITFRPEAIAAVAGVLEELGRGRARTLAVAVPSGITWMLGAYELALAAARRIPSAAVTLLTAEETPLQALGPAAGRIADLLAAAGVKLVAGWDPRSFEAGRLLLEPEATLAVDRVIALPRPRARPLPGVPADRDGWVPVDARGAIPGIEAVYAVGDMTDEPTKHGGLAARQAAAAAAAVAVSLGADVESAPYHPVVETAVFDALAPAGGVRSDLAHPAGRALEWTVGAAGPGQKPAAPYLVAALEAVGSGGGAPQTRAEGERP
jgi:sulfide:quinone oxidoreductase